MAKFGKPPAHNTMHQEVVALRQTLKTAVRHGWIDHLPDLSEPYRSNPKISHRAWFSPEEYRKLYEAQENARMSPSRRASNGNANNFTITFCFRPTPGSVLMKRGAFNSGT